MRCVATEGGTTGGITGSSIGPTEGSSATSSGTPRSARPSLRRRVTGTLDRVKQHDRGDRVGDGVRANNVDGHRQIPIHRRQCAANCSIR